MRYLKFLPAAALVAGLAAVSMSSAQAQNRVADPAAGNGPSPTAGATSATSAGNTDTTAATPYQQNEGAARNELGNSPVGSNSTVQGRSMPGAGGNGSGGSGNSR